MPAEQANPRPTSRASAEAVREELGRVLASHEFRSSKRCQDFLRYVVDAALAGQAGSLKERTIGVDVFGRSASYDTADDATVRVKAGEVRKRLGMYYASEGAAARVRIELPGGTYVPEFRCDEPAPVPVELVALQDPKRRTWWLPAAGLAVAALAAAFVIPRMMKTESALDQFWAPVLEGNSPVSLCAAHVPVWGLRDPTASHPSKLEDFVQLTDQFVGGGDLMAVSNVASMLTRMKRPYRVGVGGSVSFEDLRHGPAIIVGYSYTRWKEINNQLRFFIDASRSPLGITDNGAPTRWTLPNLPPDRRTAQDYAIVTRIFHPDTRAMMVELVGITQYGTAAAADLVTSRDLMDETLRDAPAGWQTKNMQLVLHVKVISGATASPRVVARHFW